MPSRRHRSTPPPFLLLLVIGALAGAVPSRANADQAENDTAAAAAAAETRTAAPLNARSDQDLLNWALSHSDPDALRAASEEARRGAAEGSPEFLERQRRVQQLLDALKSEPSEAELMQEAVAVLTSPSSSTQQLGNALEALRYLVEPVDLANDLHKMGGLAPLVALLRAQQPPQPHLQAGAAYVLGTAAANNVVFQKQLLGAHPEVLQLLLQLLADGGGGGDEAAASEAAAKALYCLSALLRLSPPARAAFYRAAGMATLQSLLRSPGTGPRLKRKGLGLLADLVQLDAGVHGAAAGLDMSAAVAAALQLLDGGEAAEAEADQDLQEKALLVLAALLDSPHRARAAALLVQANGPAALQRLEAAWLQEAEAAAAEEDEDGGDSAYLHDLVALCRRVQRDVAAAAAAADDDGGGGAGAPSAALGGSVHDASEL